MNHKNLTLKPSWMDNGVLLAVVLLATTILLLSGILYTAVDREFGLAMIVSALGGDVLVSVMLQHRHRRYQAAIENAAIGRTLAPRLATPITFHWSGIIMTILAGLAVSGAIVAWRQNNVGAAAAWASLSAMLQQFGYTVRDCLAAMKQLRQYRALHAGSFRYIEDIAAHLGDDRDVVGQNAHLASIDIVPEPPFVPGEFNVFAPTKPKPIQDRRLPVARPDGPIVPFEIKPPSNLEADVLQRMERARLIKQGQDQQGRLGDEDVVKACYSHIATITETTDAMSAILTKIANIVKGEPVPTDPASPELPRHVWYDLPELVEQLKNKSDDSQLKLELAQANGACILKDDALRTIVEIIKATGNPINMSERAWSTMQHLAEQALPLGSAQSNRVSETLNTQRLALADQKARVNHLSEWIDRIGFYCAGTDCHLISEKALEILKGWQRPKEPSKLTSDWVDQHGPIFSVADAEERIAQHANAHANAVEEAEDAALSDEPVPKP